MLLIGILGLCIYGLIWPWMVATSPWGSLMQKYAMILNKIDIARGRCVPVPGTILNGSKLSIISHFQVGFEVFFLGQFVIHFLARQILRGKNGGCP